MDFSNDILPVIYTIFLWWFSTGIIFIVYRRSRKFVQWSFVVGTMALVVAFIGIWFTRSLNHPRDIYLAVTCGIVVWAWQVAGYYLGFITGPHSKHYLVDDEGWERNLINRFRLALHFSMYHEILAAATCVLIAALTWSSANRWALWMYLALWLMHISARLNVFLGVRNFRIELLPKQMHYIGGLLGKRPVNALFPFSVIILSSVALLLFHQGIQLDASSAHIAGFISIGTMMILGIIEHVMLILPIPASIVGLGILSVNENNDQSPSGHSNIETNTQTVIVTGD